MSRRAMVVVGAVVVVLVAAVATWYVGRDRIVQAGDAVVVVEGRTLEVGNNVSVGVGVSGTLRLVAGRCVGLDDRIVVWPAGTRVLGNGASLRIESEGKTVRLGDEVNAGTEFGHDFDGIKEKLPKACRDAPLLQLGLNS